MEIGQLRKQYILRRTDALIYIANNKELEGFEIELQKRGLLSSSSFEIFGYEIKFFKYRDFHICYLIGSKIGPAEVYCVLNNVGIEFPNLKYVVNIGCCATVEKRVKNSVIFAERVFDADLRKETELGTLFDGKENRHSKLTNRIRNKLNKIENKQYEVLYKPLISSSALVKNRKSKKERINAYPYAAGIEMEGVAISDYALSRNIEWIIIKGTSDNAIKKGGSMHQKEVTSFATDLFFELIELDALENNNPQVFVGGAIGEDEEKLLDKNSRKRIEENCIYLGRKLLENHYKIISGYGNIVGPCMLFGAYSFMKEKGSSKLSNHIEVSPFPRLSDKHYNTAMQYYQSNRDNMITQCLAAIFVYGRNTDPEEYNGVKDEFDKAGSKDLIRFAIPVTNYYSDFLYSILKNDHFDGIGNLKHFEHKLNSLSKTPNFKKAVDIVIEMINIIDDYYFDSKR